LSGASSNNFGAGGSFFFFFFLGSSSSVASSSASSLSSLSGFSYASESSPDPESECVSILECALLARYVFYCIVCYILSKKLFRAIEGQYCRPLPPHFPLSRWLSLSRSSNPCTFGKVRLFSFSFFAILFQSKCNTPLILIFRASTVAICLRFIHRRGGFRFRGRPARAHLARYIYFLFLFSLYCFK
jgi:hypothetical protein